MITIEDFAKIEMKVGLVTAAVAKEGSDKLIRLTVDLGEETPRTIFTAIRKWYEPEYFVNKKLIFVTNLEPKKIMDEESQGMIMAVDGPDGKPILLVPEAEVAIGAGVR